MTCRNMSEAESAWLAGIIDGEGTIGIWSNGKSSRRTNYVAHLQVGNTNTQMLLRIVEFTGCGTINSGKARRENHKQLYKWRVNPMQIRGILPQIEPYLVIKRFQAQLVIEYLRMQKDGRGIEGEFKLAYAEKIINKVRELNQRGVEETEEIRLTLRDSKERKRTCDIEDCDNRRYGGQCWCYQHWLERKEPALITCAECGKVDESILATKKFCSSKCQWKAYYKENKETLNSRRRLVIAE